ncbi:hypothetical protein EIELFIGP_01719 [Stenotrophomonas maltophilia]|uniref:hypothetical protein n=1 Tax=Stenotrophomonas maltophilia TaxID=40324 RepID=UPI0012AF2A78|nr:hypothetical protein [Stenotrophomonas maltophilia]QGM11144.1 hypothetical protein FEO84_18170 [Stenotrophomonas maltophilia]QNG72910.1 hypothetical protein EIELFIGP_01719 [Stenotrophomonas maltophilia]
MSAQEKYSLQERGRFKAWWDAARPLEGSAFPYEIAWAAWQAALSAQPSPGGQGGLNYERMFVDACAALAEVSRELGCDPEQGGAEPILAAIAELRESVAARQPVGEPVAEAIEQLADDVESCVSDACGYLASDSGWDDYGIYRDDAAERYRALPDRIRALSAPPAQADQEYLESLDRALEGVIDERDRYHEMADDLAGHIAAITGVDIGEHSSANCPWQNAIEAAEEYQPAQAVDLERFRPAVMTALGLSSPHGLERETLNELLDLIDSQAVGK